ncbi:MAG: ATP-binding cassette domain-containing protein [Lachnospiraceae bacterium]|nr:ATP-binding cassette domain-containing protein [Lachnospiraceae bacterium]
MSEALIRIENVKKSFAVSGQKGLTVKAVDDVSFDIEQGQIIGVVGESGCGKSTLGRCVMHLTGINGGSIFYKDTEISKLGEREMKEYRKHMQMVFQNPFSSFNPRHTIGRALMDVAKEYGLKKEEALSRINNLVQEIGLDPVVLTRRPSELSGGQLQRLAIARALIVNPEFILADEAVSALDVSVQAQILNMIMELREKYNLTMLFISHDLTVVEHISDEVVVMYLGKVMERGTTEELFGDTRHPYTKALLSAKPKERPDMDSDRIILSGDVPNAINVPAHCRFCTRCPEFVPGLCDAKTPELVNIGGRHWVACHKAIDNQSNTKEENTNG